MRAGDRVDRVRQVRLALGLVNCGVGSGVDDDVGREIAYERGSGFRICEIHLGARTGGHIAQRRQRALQLPSNLSGGSRDEHAQAHGW